MKQFFIFLFSLFLFTSCNRSEEYLKIATCYWPGYVHETSAEKSFLSNLVTLAFQEVGIKVKYSFFHYKESYLKTKSGDFDLTLGWQKFKRDEKYFDYSDESYTEKISFFHLKKNAFEWENMKSLRELSIGAFYPGEWLPDYQLGTYGSHFMDFANKGEIDVNFTPSPFENIRGLLNGTYKIAPMNLQLGYSLINDLIEKKEDKDKFTHHGKPLNSKSYHYLLVSKKLPKERRVYILNSFKKGFEILQKKGVIKKLFKEHKMY